MCTVYCVLCTVCIMSAVCTVCTACAVCIVSAVCTVCTVCIVSTVCIVCAVCIVSAVRLPTHTQWSTLQHNPSCVHSCRTHTYVCMYCVNRCAAMHVHV